MVTTPQFLRTSFRKPIEPRSWWHEEDLKRSRRSTPRRVNVLAVDRFHIHVMSYVQDVNRRWIPGRRSEILRRSFETGWRELGWAEIAEITGASTGVASPPTRDAEALCAK